MSQGLGTLIESIGNLVADVLPTLLSGLGWIMDNANTIATAMEVFKAVTMTRISN